MFFTRNENELDALLKQAKKALNIESEEDEKDLKEEDSKEDTIPEIKDPEENTEKDPDNKALIQEIITCFKQGEFGKAVEHFLETIKVKSGVHDESLIDLTCEALCPGFGNPDAAANTLDTKGDYLTVDQVQKLKEAVKNRLNAMAAEEQGKAAAKKNKATSEIMSANTPAQTSDIEQTNTLPGIDSNEPKSNITTPEPPQKKEEPELDLGPKPEPEDEFLKVEQGLKSGLSKEAAVGPEETLVKDGNKELVYNKETGVFSFIKNGEYVASGRAGIDTFNTTDNQTGYKQSLIHTVFKTLPDNQELNEEANIFFSNHLDEIENKLSQMGISDSISVKPEETTEAIVNKEDVINKADDQEVLNDNLEGKGINPTSSIQDKIDKIASLLKDIKEYQPEPTKEDIILSVAASTNDSLSFLKKTAKALDERSKSAEYPGRKAFTDKTITKEGGDTPKFPGQKVMMQNTQKVVSVHNLGDSAEYDVINTKADRQMVTSINTGSGTIAFLQPIPLGEPVHLEKAFDYNGIVTGEVQKKNKGTGEQLAGAGHETQNYLEQVDKLANKKNVAGKWPASAGTKSVMEKEASPLGFSLIRKVAEGPLDSGLNMSVSSTAGSDASLGQDAIKKETVVSTADIEAARKDLLKKDEDIRSACASAHMPFKKQAAKDKEDSKKKDSSVKEDKEKTDPTTVVDAPIQKELTKLIKDIQREDPNKFNEFKSIAEIPSTLETKIIDYLKQKKQIIDADKFKACNFEQIAKECFGIKTPKLDEKKKDTKPGPGPKKGPGPDEGEGEGGDIPDLADLLG